MSDTATLDPPKTPETVKDDDVSFLDEFVSGRTAKSTDEKPTKKADKKEDVTPASTATTATDAAAPNEEAPAKPKKAKPTPAATAPLPPQPAPVDYEKIAEASGRGAAAALSKATEKKAPDVTDVMTEAERDRHGVLQRMEKEFPATAGAAKEFSDSIQRAVAYQHKWEKENPGQEYEPDGAEHKQFYDDNDPRADAHYYARTIARMETERGLEKTESKESKRLAELEAKEKLREAEPMIAAAAAHARQSFYGMAGDDFAKAVDANGNVDHAELKRIVDADPAKSAIVQAGNSVPMFAADVMKVGRRLVEFDGTNKGHLFIQDFLRRQQQAVKAYPPESQAQFAKQLNRTDADGSRFVTVEEYDAMPPNQRGNYWCLNDSDLVLLYAAEQAALAKKSVADEEIRWEATAKARGYQKVNGAPTPLAKSAAPLETPLETRTPTNSPAATIAPMTAHAAGDKSAPQKNNTDSFLSDWLR